MKKGGIIIIVKTNIFLCVNSKRFKIIGIGNFNAVKYESKRSLLMNRCKGGYIKIPEMSENILREILRSRFRDEFTSTKSIGSNSSSTTVGNSSGDISERVLSLVKYLRMDKGM
jgi:hypothetical protein